MEVPVTLQMNCANPDGNVNTTRKGEQPHKSYVVTLASSFTSRLCPSGQGEWMSPAALHITGDKLS